MWENQIVSLAPISGTCNHKVSLSRIEWKKFSFYYFYGLQERLKIAAILSYYQFKSVRVPSINGRPVAHAEVTWTLFCMLSIYACVCGKSFQFAHCPSENSKTIQSLQNTWSCLGLFIPLYLKLYYMYLLHIALFLCNHRSTEICVWRKSSV